MRKHVHLARRRRPDKVLSAVRSRRLPELWPIRSAKLFWSYLAGGKGFEAGLKFRVATLRGSRRVGEFSLVLA